MAGFEHEVRGQKSQNTSNFLKLEEARRDSFLKPPEEHSPAKPF